ncbi:MAG TPA: PASTA domain-containing protein [Thermoanaerobaculia bacterium]|nr:PASTA domain-containing protein [Thermoanaerobaculia bacterium]
MPPVARKALRWTAWGLIFIAYAGALFVVFTLASYAAFSLFVRSGATPAPEIVGLSSHEARDLLTDSGLVMSTAESGRFDAEVAAGSVLEQKPSPRTLVKRGSRVEVVLSLGPQQLTVPDLTGRSFQAAQVALASNGLALGRTLQVVSRTSPGGTVVAQAPSPGQQVTPSGTVDLMLAQGSNGGQRYVMPDLVYRDYDDVRRFFEAAGLRLGRVTFELYEGVRGGTVLRQFPVAGHPLTPQDAVSLVVATTPETLVEESARRNRDPRNRSLPEGIQPSDPSDTGAAESGGGR